MIILLPKALSLVNTIDIPIQRPPCPARPNRKSWSMPKRAKPTATQALQRAENLKAEAAQAKRTATKLEKEAIQRLGLLALQAGLADVKVSDRKMAAGLSDLAERFH